MLKLICAVGSDIYFEEKSISWRRMLASCFIHDLPDAGLVLER